MSWGNLHGLCIRNCACAHAWPTVTHLNTPLPTTLFQRSALCLNMVDLHWHYPNNLRQRPVHQKDQTPRYKRSGVGYGVHCMEKYTDLMRPSNHCTVHVGLVHSGHSDSSRSSRELTTLLKEAGGHLRGFCGWQLLSLPSSAAQWWSFKWDQGRFFFTPHSNHLFSQKKVETAPAFF